MQQFNQVITIMGDNKLVITTGPKTFFDISKDTGNHLEHEIDSVIKHNELLVKHTIKNEVIQLLSKYKDGSNIHEHFKHNEPHKLFLKKLE